MIQSLTNNLVNNSTVNAALSVSALNRVGAGSLHISNGSAEVIPKTPAYVFGERVVKPMIDSLSSFFGGIGSHFKSLTGRVQSSPEMPKAESATSCFNEVLRAYPGLSDSEKQAVQDICDNELTSIQLQGFPLSTLGMKALAMALKTNTALTSLTIENGICRFDDEVEAISALINSLKVNRTLKALSLESCSLNSEAMELLFQNLPCFNLAELIKSPDTYSGITPSSAQALAETLLENRFPLASLSLTDSSLDDATVEVIASGIAGNPCLQHLDISDELDDSYTQESVETIFSAMAQSKALASLNIKSEGEMDTINQALVLNSVQENTCFLNLQVDTSWAPGFPEDLADKVKELVSGRTPCPQNPSCQKPKNCPIPPDQSPSSSSKKQILGAAIGGTIGTGAGVGLAVYAKKRWGNKEKKEPLLANQV